MIKGLPTASKGTRHLYVHRRLSSAQKILVGQLAQNSSGIFFQYDDAYLSQYHSLSPFTLPFNSDLNKAEKTPHQGLHGVFSDSLPDGWGMLIMDRVFRRQGIPIHTVTPLDRLAYIGDRGTGALCYTPAMEHESAELMADLALLGKEAALVFEGQTDEVLAQLADAGGSGGARPKALIYLDPDNVELVSTASTANHTESWLVKFTSGQLPLGHEEGLCEAAWLTMAADCGIDVPEWRLFRLDDGQAWLALKRFDCCHGASGGRLHMHTLCGLLDADYRQPSMDYEDLIKVSQVLCKQAVVGQIHFIRAVFNLFAANQDDHTKNWSFLMSDDGQWSPAPFYDVTFSPSPYGEHSTAYGGYGKQPPLKTIQNLARLANFGSWKEVKLIIDQVCGVLSGWPAVAGVLGISAKTIKEIGKQLDVVYQENKQLLS